MAVNPDPKPGRWILPLVILGMIAFTYFFVSSLPEASPTTTLAVGSSTTIPDSSGSSQPSGTTVAPGDAQGYVDQLDTINTALQEQATELAAVNSGFDADPRSIEFDDAESRMEAVANATQDLADQVAALTVPAGLETNHEALVSAIGICAGAADDALSGLRSTDTGELRRNAVETFTTSAGDFDTEVQNVKTASGIAPDA